MILNIVHASFILVILTKLLDIYSTLKYLGPKQERNPIVQLLLLKFGLSFHVSIMLVSVFYYVVIAFVYLSLDKTILENSFYGVMSSLECLLISYFQVGAYFLNAKGKHFPGIRFLLNTNWYRKF